VLVYDAFQSPLAQPRNVIGGYIVSSFVGVSVRIIGDHIFTPDIYVTAAFAMMLSIIVMNITKTVHPPGGACAVIAVIGGDMVHGLGYGYMLTATGGAFVVLTVALLGNNLVPTRQYPLYWW
jgi:CBS-domain-containing membrane protein